MILSIQKLSVVVIVLCSIFLLSSCTDEKFLFVIPRVRVKNYPADTPFVYNNKVNISGNINKDEKKRLEENLTNYWADSLFARRVLRFGVQYLLQNPPVFDTSTISTTQSFMSGYLFSQGYFRTAMKDSFHMDTVTRGNKPAQYRTTIIMNIDAGNRALIDSLGYDLNDTALQRITKNNLTDSKIDAGKTPYSKEIIAAELDWLVALYRDRGYFLLRRDNLAAVVDTLNALLLKPTADPFEQVQLLEEAQQSNKETSPLTVTIQQRRLADTTTINTDSSFLKKFYVGRINYYPETYLAEFPDSLLKHSASFNQQTNRAYTVYYRQGQFNPKIFRQFNYIRSEHLYNDDLFLKQ